MSEVTITCWQCEESMTLAQRGDEDGQCPHCGAEVDLEDYLIAAKAEAQALREEVAALRTKLAMAEDAAAKGDAARQQCGGMEMEIQELRAELAALRARVVVLPSVDNVMNIVMRYQWNEKTNVTGTTNWAANLGMKVVEEVKRLNGKTVSEGLLRGMGAFAQEIISGALEGGSFDGAELQESAERHGLIAKQVMREPCRGPEEYCACAWSTSFPTECYRITAELRALLNQDKENGNG
ncbi:hypothetical protein ACM7EK_30290 [Pseudomonas aeruginosa]|nr:hypothetical protein [Pseudomonas aeruginosa]